MKPSVLKAWSEATKEKDACFLGKIADISLTLSAKWLLANFVMSCCAAKPSVLSALLANLESGGSVLQIRPGDSSKKHAINYLGHRQRKEAFLCTGCHE